MKLRLVTTFIAVAFASVVCRADTIETVTLNTASLSGASSGQPFALAFSLNDGGQLNNNTVTLSNFSFAGGSASGSAITSDCSSAFFTCGGESGTIDATNPGSSVVTLSDTGFYNGLVEDFTPGNTLSFSLDLTSNPDLCAGCGDDSFVFQILSPCGSLTDACNNLPTSDAAFSSFVTADLSTNQTLAFSSTSYPGMTANVAVSSVPEPSTLLLLVPGLAAMARWRRRSAELNLPDSVRQN